MGKYSVDTTNRVKLDYVNTRMLVSIANELAEANRLKRLELQDKIKAKDEVVEMNLSDQA